MTLVIDLNLKFNYIIESVDLNLPVVKGDFLCSAIYLLRHCQLAKETTSHVLQFGNACLQALQMTAAYYHTSIQLKCFLRSSTLWFILASLNSLICVKTQAVRVKPQWQNKIHAQIDSYKTQEFLGYIKYLYLYSKPVENGICWYDTLSHIRASQLHQSGNDIVSTSPIPSLKNFSPREMQNPTHALAFSYSSDVFSHLI